MTFQTRYNQGKTIEPFQLRYLENIFGKIYPLAKDTTAEYNPNLTSEERKLPDFWTWYNGIKLPIELKSTPCVNWKNFNEYPTNTYLCWFEGDHCRSDFIADIKFFNRFRGPFPGSAKGSGKPFIVLI